MNNFTINRTSPSPTRKTSAPPSSAKPATHTSTQAKDTVHFGAFRGPHYQQHQPMPGGFGMPVGGGGLPPERPGGFQPGSAHQKEKTDAPGSDTSSSGIGGELEERVKRKVLRKSRDGRKASVTKFARKYGIPENRLNYLRTQISKKRKPSQYKSAHSKAMRIRYDNWRLVEPWIPENVKKQVSGTGTNGETKMRQLRERFPAIVNSLPNDIKNLLPQKKDSSRASSSIASSSSVSTQTAAERERDLVSRVIGTFNSNRQAYPPGDARLLPEANIPPSQRLISTRAIQRVIDSMRSNANRGNTTNPEALLALAIEMEQALVNRPKTPDLQISPEQLSFAAQGYQTSQSNFYGHQASSSTAPIISSPSTQIAHPTPVRPSRPSTGRWYYNDSDTHRAYLNPDNTYGDPVPRRGDTPSPRPEFPRQ
jgi:hypothetical protein